jgi:tetratricopeptide (TPR) repeat protein
MVLGGDLRPIRELSAAFLTAKSDEDLQFAYFQSMLVVEFLVERYGHDVLRRILRDLGQGTEINAAIAAATEPMDALEKAFAAATTQKAEQLGPEMDWTKPSPDALAQADAEELAKHPRNFYLLTQGARAALEAKQWAAAKAPAQTLLELFPSYTGPDNAYAMLAAAHRGLGETNLEATVLTRLAALDADAIDAYSRLMDLDAAGQQWTNVVVNAERYVAVNPLTPAPYRLLAQAHENLAQPAPAIEAWRQVLLLDPPDPAEVHFRLARLLAQTGDPGARRHVLQALEEAPRFRAAHRLLLDLEPTKPAPTPAPAPAPAPASAPESPPNPAPAAPSNRP